MVVPAYVGLCGSDLHICRGEHPRARPGLVIGHEVVGRLAGGPGDLASGTAVFVNPLLACGTCPACVRGLSHVCEHLRLIGIDVNGGAAELLAAPAANLVPLPPSLELRHAALIEPLAVAVHALRRGELRPGERVHVLGAGPIGLLVASCAHLAGAAPVTVSEPVASRAEGAAALGFRVVDDGTGQHTADVVFDCTGHPSVSPGVLGWAATGGTVVAVGIYPGVVGVNLQELSFRELKMTGTRVYTPDDVNAAIKLIADGAADFSRLVTDVLALHQGGEAIARLQAGRDLKVLIKSTGG